MSVELVEKVEMAAGYCPVSGCEGGLDYGSFEPADDAGAKGVRAHNAYADLVTALDGLLASFYDGGEGGPDAVFQRQTEAAHAAQKALDRHRRPT